MIRRYPLTAPGSGGGTSVSPIVTREAVITDGSGATLPNTGGLWAPVTGFLLPIPAVVGDRVRIGIHGMRSATASAFLDAGVVVAGNIVRFMATRTASPAPEGDPGWYISTTFPAQSAPRGFVATSGDIDSGNVVFAIVTNATGSGTVYATTTYMFSWYAENLGPAPS